MSVIICESFQVDSIWKVWKEIWEEAAEEERGQTQSSRTSVGVVGGYVSFDADGK